MRIVNGMLTHQVSQGLLSLQVPDLIKGNLTYEGACTDYPDAWFCRLAYNEPRVGEEQGLLYYTRAGYKANKAELEAAFVSYGGRTWADFVEHAAHHFAEVEAAQVRRILLLESKLEALKLFKV